MEKCYPLHIFLWTVNFGGGIALGTAIGCVKHNWIVAGVAFLFALISAYFVHSNERDYWTKRKVE